MNKRQLMLDCLNGKPTERVPGSFWFHNQPDEKTGEKAVQAHLKLIREGDIDFVKIMDETELPFDFQTADDWKHYKPLSLHDPLLEKQYHVIDTFAPDPEAKVAIWYGSNEPNMKKAMQKLKRAYPNAQDHPFVGYGHGDIIGHPDVMARDIIAFMKS